MNEMNETNMVTKKGKKKGLIAGLVGVGAAVLAVGAVVCKTMKKGKNSDVDVTGDVTEVEYEEVNSEEQAE